MTCDNSTYGQLLTYDNSTYDQLLIYDNSTYGQLLVGYLVITECSAVLRRLQFCAQFPPSLLQSYDFSHLHAQLLLAAGQTLLQGRQLLLVT